MTETTQPREQALFEAYADDNGIPIPADYSDCNAAGSGWFACFKAGMQAAIAPVAAPEAPILTIYQARQEQSWAWTDISRDVYEFVDPKFRRIVYASTEAAPLVPEVAASEQQDLRTALIELASVQRKLIDANAEIAALQIQANCATPAATTVCAPNCFYGDCPPCVAAGLVPAAATTASASTDALLEAHAAAAIAAHEHGEQAGYYHDLRAAEKAIRDACRATAPSRNAAPLDDAAVEKWVGENINTYFSHDSGRGSNIMWANADDIRLFIRAALTQQSAAKAPNGSFSEIADFLDAIAQQGMKAFDAEYPTLDKARCHQFSRELRGAAQASHAGADTEKQAARYCWLRDKSEPGICAFYLSVGQAFKDVKFTKETVDDAIDAQIAAMSAATEQGEKP